jgi:hypothetical protein
MVSKKKTPVKKSVGKLKLKKETIRDLDAKGKSSMVKGGQADRSHIGGGCVFSRDRAMC